MISLPGNSFLSTIISSNNFFWNIDFHSNRQRGSGGIDVVLSDLHLKPTENISGTQTAPKITTSPKCWSAVFTSSVPVSMTTAWGTVYN